MRTILPLTVILLLFGGSIYASDPVAAEIEKWHNFVRTHPATNEDSKSIYEITEPVLQKATEALSANRRLLALHYLASANVLLAANQYVENAPAKMRDQLSYLDSEWKKVGAELQPILTGKQLIHFQNVPAAVRAIGEASLTEIKPYYEASLEYGRNTAPEYGLFYLGSAEAQLDFAKFCATLEDTQTTLRPPEMKNLDAEMQSYEDQLLAAYKPPASIDSHPLFIRTSALLKEARELENAKSNYGALYLYLNSRLKLTQITVAKLSMETTETTRRAKEAQDKLRSTKVDHSIAELYIQLALAEGGQSARGIFEDVLPHYYAALQNPKPQAPKPPPVATVTLVRWPYT